MCFFDRFGSGRFFLVRLFFLCVAKPAGVGIQEASILYDCFGGIGLLNLSSKIAKKRMSWKIRMEIKRFGVSKPGGVRVWI